MTGKLAVFAGLAVLLITFAATLFLADRSTEENSGLPLTPGAALVSSAQHSGEQKSAEKMAVEMPVTSAHPAWMPVATAARSPKDSRVALISPPQVSQFVEGDVISIPVPQESRSYNGTVERKIISVSGNTSIMGTFADGPFYKFTITQGRVHSFATFNTPVGNYSMDADDAVGRIVPATVIDDKINYDKPDYRVPPQPSLGVQSTTQG